MTPITSDLDIKSTMALPSRHGDPVWELALFHPRQGEWTEAAYLALDTNRFVELSDGCLEFPPMPTLLHQFVMLFLLDALRIHIKEHAVGAAVPAPLPVRLWPGKMREPDIVYLRPERLSNIKGQPNGADLAVEIVSEGSENRKRDLMIKRAEYAQADIAEYWIVDPQEQRITVLTLAGQAYREHGVFGPGSEATSVLLPGFAVQVDAVFAAGNG